MPSKTEKITQELYNGEVAITFYPNIHRYKKEGERTFLISSTGATGKLDKSTPLVIWATRLFKDYLLQYLEESKSKNFTKEELYPIIDEGSRQHTAKKEEAASFGDIVHDWCLAFGLAKLQGKELGEETLKDLPKEALKGINAFLDWYNNHDVEFEYVDDKIVYSRKHEFVGIPDFIGKVDGGKTVIDYKTSKNIYSAHYYQLSSYRFAYEEEIEPVDQSGILHFDKETGEFNYITVPDEDSKEDYKAFLGLLAVAKREKIRERMRREAYHKKNNAINEEAFQHNAFT